MEVGRRIHLDVGGIGFLLADLFPTLSVDEWASRHQRQDMVEVQLQVSGRWKSRDQGEAPSVLGYVGVSRHMP